MIRDMRVVLPGIFVIFVDEDQILIVPTYQHRVCRADTVYYLTSFADQASLKSLGHSGSSLQTQKSAFLKLGTDLLHSLEALASLL